MKPALKFLAFDTSTDVLSVALSDGTQTWGHEGAGGAQASAQLIPTVLDLLAQAGWALPELDAIVFGRGPGSFTGLRTACAVAQGLAYGAAVPVLPVDTLLAVAEQARWDLQGAQAKDAPLCVLALLDARMDEVYSAAYEWQGAARGWRVVQDLQVGKPETVTWPSDAPGNENGNGNGNASCLCAGNAFGPYGARLTSALPNGLAHVVAMPTAQALLRLAPALFQAGLAVPAEQAMPLYVRDKVANTTAEREVLKAQKLTAQQVEKEAEHQAAQQAVPREAQQAQHQAEQGALKETLKEALKETRHIAAPNLSSKLV
jgi:tRNA threonylcarbamoyladenosine biosynthesis protein TsaB